MSSHLDYKLQFFNNYCVNACEITNDKSLNVLRIGVWRKQRIYLNISIKLLQYADQQ